MSKKKRHYTKRDRRVVVQGVRRETADLRRLSHVLLQQAQVEVDARTQVSPPAVAATGDSEVADDGDGDGQ